MIKNAKIVSIGKNSDDYHAQEAERGSREFVMSSSRLRDFGQCPERWRNGYSSPDSDAKKWGSLVDTRLLTPEQFPSRYAVTPETYETTGMQCPVCLGVSDSKECRKCKTPRREVKLMKPWNGNSSVCATWIDARKEEKKEIVSSKLVNDCDAALKRLWSDKVIADFIGSCDTQVHITAEWHDAETGLVVPIQALLDLVPRLNSNFRRVAGDLKTTRNGQRVPWLKFMFQSGYYVQGSFGLDLLNSAEGAEEGIGRMNFCFVLQENFAPWQPGRRMMTEKFLALGRIEYARLLGNYAACLLSDKWPGYDDDDSGMTVQGWSLVDPDEFMVESVSNRSSYDFSEEPPEEEAVESLPN